MKTILLKSRNLLGCFVVLAACGGDEGPHPTGPSTSSVATTITISPNTLTFNGLGQTSQLSATVKDQNGSSMSNASVAWSTSRAAVATVSSSGVVTSVGNGSATITGTSGSAQGTAAVTVEPVSIESLALNLKQYVPSWDDLKVFTDTVARLPYPTYQKRALAWGEAIQGDDRVRAALTYYDSIYETYGANISPALFTDMPPFAFSDGSDLTYPLPTEILDEKLRATATVFLRAKSKGRPTTLVNFYPPNWEAAPFTTEAAFDQWIDLELMPEKVAEAQAAELMKAEYLIAFPLEFELWVKDRGGSGDGGFLDSMSDGEILSFATNLKNKIRDGIKQHYNGKLIAHIYNNYFWDTSPSWEGEMTYEGFDEVHAAIFPQGSVELTASYMDAQIAAYTRIVERSRLHGSGNIDWVANEISIFEQYFPDTDLEAIERDLLETVFTKLESAVPAPVGVAPGVGVLRTQAAQNYVTDYFSSR